MRSRRKEDMIKAYESCYAKLMKAGINPVIQRLDNEISTELIETLENNQLKYQITSPGDHRLDPAEHVIQTLKNNYIAGLSGVYLAFPETQWDFYLEQSVITINLLRESRINPELSAYTQVFGE